MSDFDPWSAGLDDALAQPEPHSPHGAVLRWAVAQEIIQKRKHFEMNPLDGIARCVRAGLIAPDWLALLFLRQYDKVLNCRVGSWDAAFGNPFPKGRQLASMRRSRTNRMRVVVAVANAISKEPERPIDVSFWEEIGQSIGEGKTRAQDLHAEAVKFGYAISPTIRKKKLM